MCHLSTKDQDVCQSNHRIAEAVTGVLGGAQFSACPLYHPRSSRGRFGHPREAVVGAGNFPDSNGISDDFKRQNRSHQTEPVPRSAKVCEIGENLLSISAPISRPQERLIYASAFLRPPTLQPRTMSRVHPYTPVARSCTPMSPVPESGG